MPKMQRIGIWVAGIVAGFGMLGILSNPWHPLLALPWAVAALMLRRGQSWGGYGLALWQAAMTICIGARAVSKPHQPVNSELALVLVLSLAAAALMYLAGRAAKEDRIGGRWAWVLLSVASVLFLVTWQPFKIPTGAMEKTILIGDYLLVRRSPGLRPERRDIVVFRYPVDPRQTFIKRVVGLPGDRIRISGKILMLNGEPQTEPYVWRATDYVDSYRDNFPSEPNLRLYAPAEAMLRDHVVAGEVVVPPGKYFGLGDNRDSSLDSRYWGFIDQSDILGKPWIVYFSADLPSDATMEGGFQIAITRTRWDRFFKRPQ